MSDAALIAIQPVAVITVTAESGPSIAVAVQQAAVFVAAAGQGAAGRDGRDGGGAGGTTVTVYEVQTQATGTQVLSLPSAVGDYSALFINGVRQRLSNYSFSGSVVVIPAATGVTATDQLAFEYAPLSNTGYVASETPQGQVDGGNKTYTLAHLPVVNTVQVVLNGQLLTRDTDYTVSGSQVTIAFAPVSRSVLRASYQQQA